MIRFVSLLLIAGTAAFLAYNFWKGCAPYGDPLTASEEKNIVLAAYAAVAGFFLLFECISFLWAMTRVRIREGRDLQRRYRTGIVFVPFHLCVLLCLILDEPHRPTISRRPQRDPRRS